MNRIKMLRNKISALKRELEANENELIREISACSHEWSAVVPDHIYEAGYTIPGDEPGTMGVDWCGPCNVPSKTIKRWKRTCMKCGEIQHTSKVEKQVTEIPKF